VQPVVVVTPSPVVALSIDAATKARQQLESPLPVRKSRNPLPEVAVRPYTVPSHSSRLKPLGQPQVSPSDSTDSDSVLHNSSLWMQSSPIQVMGARFSPSKPVLGRLQACDACNEPRVPIRLMDLSDSTGVTGVQIGPVSPKLVLPPIQSPVDRAVTAGPCSSPLKGALAVSLPSGSRRDVTRKIPHAVSPVKHSRLPSASAPPSHVSTGGFTFGNYVC
jgi:hypothetical protein